MEQFTARFGVEFPVSFDVVKKKYREALRFAHPDRPENVDKHAANEKSKILNHEYELMKKLFEQKSSIFSEFFGKSVYTDQHTHDGFPFAELGLGLGPIVNGKECQTCEGKGYKVSEGKRGCTRCNFTEIQINLRDCNPCMGSGSTYNSVLKRGFRCKNCNGSGKIEREIVCSCVFSGKPKGAWKCYTCEGTGEIKIDNPVISKGRLA